MAGGPSKTPRNQRLRSNKYHKNIHNRGNVTLTSVKRDEGNKVGPILLGFFLFVVVGSAVLQIIRTAQTGNPGME